MLRTECEAEFKIQRSKFKIKVSLRDDFKIMSRANTKILISAF